MVSALSLCALSTANAYDLSDFVKVKDGLYASLDKDGTLTEIAVTEQAKLAMDLDESDEASNAIRKLLDSKNNVNKSTIVNINLCTAYDVLHDEVVSINGNNLSLTAEGRVFVGGTSPPPPKFAFARAKAKLKGYDASGTFVVKSMAVDREGVNDSGFSANSSNSSFSANYATAFASAEMNTVGLDRINWTAKTDYLVDNPADDQNNAQAAQLQDCYQSFTVKVSNDVYL